MDHGFEVFLPLVQTKRASQPLFRGYFFCRIVDRWRSINTTFGVLCLVRVGDCPARCPTMRSIALKAMIDGHGYIKLPETPATPIRRQIPIGVKVRIAAGLRRDERALRRYEHQGPREDPAQSSWRSTSGVDRRQPGRSAVTPAQAAEQQLIDAMRDTPRRSVIALANAVGGDRSSREKDCDSSPGAALSRRTRLGDGG